MDCVLRIEEDQCLLNASVTTMHCTQGVCATNITKSCGLGGSLQESSCLLTGGQKAARGYQLLLSSLKRGLVLATTFPHVLSIIFVVASHGGHT